MKNAIRNTGKNHKTLGFAAGFCILMCVLTTGVLAQNTSASFTSNVFSGCSPLSVDFINLSSQANSYYWDFGNGNVSTLDNPTTVYITPGYYTVMLVAIDTVSGDRDTLVATNYIHVVDDPVADFSASPLTGCLGNHIITFTNLSSGATTYIWDFGDGTFSTLTNPTHVYLNTGTYTVKLIARNAYGCNDIRTQTNYIDIVPNPPASFIVSQQSSCNVNTVFGFSCTTPGAVSWEWSFGDGSLSTLQNPTHVYGVPGSFDVTLIVINSNGCTDTLFNPGYINIGNSLVPSFTVNSTTGCAPFVADFQCNVPNAITWSWDFGDGTTSSVQNPSNTYGTPGTYDITLTVTTASGCNGTVVLPAYITVDASPVPSFTVTNPIGCAPQQVTFNNTSTGGATYLWDFGDGFTSTDPNPVYTYADTGTYSVSLTAYSINGCAATVTIPAAVNIQSMMVGFTAITRVGCAPLTVDFTGTSSPAAVTWNWDFGDGTTGSGQNPSHTYTTVGNYSVTLVGTSAFGCIDSLRRVNYIRIVNDSTPYTVPDTIIVCLPPGSVAFTDPTTGSNSWFWNFGDGTTGTTRNPTHAYTAPGVYTVTLNTSMAGGCSQAFNPFAYVHVIGFMPSPITAVITSPCSPFTVAFDNGTLNVASYNWNFGDGMTSTLQNPVHVYALPGTYTVSLQLTSVDGCSISLSTTVSFGHLNPILVSDDDVCLGDTIVFTLNPASAFVSMNWNFGDGTTSSQPVAAHLFGVPGSYVVTVNVTDTMGCNYTYLYPSPILVSNPIPLFNINQSGTGCIPFGVLFNNTSTGASSYSWDFGDGGTSSAQYPVHTYNAPGTYDVTLVATMNGCSRSLTLDDLITAFGAQAACTFTPDSGCIPITVTFTDQSVNAVSWLWNFGDGNTSNVQNPVHIYSSIPSGPVTLTITDNNGCIDNVSIPSVVPVIPDITVSDTVACRPATIQFSTTVSAILYLWDFGDGTTSTLQNPSHFYSLSGTYTVILSCILASGCNTATNAPGLITIVAPVADFSSPNVAVCAPSLVNFTNQSTGAVSYLWDFGDGTNSVNSDPAHIYNVPGSYTVTLVATSASGCSDTLIRANYIGVPGTLTTFSISDSSICQNDSVQFTDLSMNASDWFWNFGDGFTSTLQNPTHVYADSGSYTVTLITADSVGCSSFYTWPAPIEIHAAPVASASLTPDAGCVPFSVAFTNLSTGNGSYVWDFGNGTTSGLTDPTCTYVLPGIFYPTLTVTTPFGCTDTFAFSNGITAGNDPVAGFTTPSVSGCAPFSVQFTNSSTNLANPTYNWSFGNGDTSIGQNPVYTYNVPGVYQVTLEVVNTTGCRDSVSQTITVLAPPVAQMVPSTLSGCGPLTVDFTDQSQNATTYLWDFGDGTTSSMTNPSHVFATPGTYMVTLVVSSSNGCADTLALATPIQVLLAPNASFTRTPGSGCLPLDVVFTSTSTQLANPSYSWNFGNGQTGNSIGDTITYTSSGQFPVTLVVTNNNGCADSLVRNVTAKQTPDALGTVDIVSGCSPVSVQFSNNSLNANTYLWQFGDGSTSVQTNPAHTYATPGTYQPYLVALAATGCVDTFWFPVPVTSVLAPIASLSASATTACAPAQILFTDQSSQLTSPAYSWNLGNGQSGTGNSINGMFNAGGTYTITLVVTNAGGCNDTAIASVQIYDMSVISASTQDTSGCAPYTASFQNNTLNGTAWLWNFGDGTTSVQQAPSHTYTSTGSYSVTLIAYNGGSCNDTLILPQTIQVNQSPSAGISAPSLTGCTPFTVDLTNTSTNLANPVFDWDFGNGIHSALQDPTFVYTTSGVYNVSLTVINQGGCIDTDSLVISVGQSPQAIAAPYINSGCAPLQVVFHSTSVFANSVYWNLGNGAVSLGGDTIFNFTQPGIYQPYLVATTTAGCTDTLFTAPITVYSVPQVMFTAAQTSGCPGTNFQFTNLTVPSTGLQYQWNIAGVVSTAENPSVILQTPGIYNVQLIATNADGCSDTLIIPNYIQVFDSLPPPASPILSVSVVDNNSVMITWQNSAALDLGAYVLYRYNPVSGIYQEIYRDTNPSNSTMAVSSNYTDTGLNTLLNTYTYKLSTLDICAHALPLSALTAHTTINVIAAPIASHIRVTWTPYAGCPVGSYQLYREEVSTGTTVLLATLQPAILTYTDTGFVCPLLFAYRITATDLCGLPYTSQSDTAMAQPVNPLLGQKTDVVRSTVIDDRDVLTEWLPPVIAPNRVVEYIILRSDDHVQYTEIARVPAGTLSYIDYQAAVHQQEYYYRIDVINDCMESTTQGQKGSSIYLQSIFGNDKARLWWSPYFEWNSGVDHYTIERLNDSGQWTPVKTVDGNTLQVIIDE